VAVVAYGRLGSRRSCLEGFHDASRLDRRDGLRLGSLRSAGDKEWSAPRRHQADQQDCSTEKKLMALHDLRYFNGKRYRCLSLGEHG
jgi:hypothetical protein